MVGASRFFGTGSLLTVGAATLAAALALREARRSVELAGDRLGHLRAEQARLLATLREERRTFEEELGQEREQRLEAQRTARREREGREQERRARLEAEKKIDRLEKEVRELREAQERRAGRLEKEIRELRKAQRDREARGEGARPVPADRPSGGPSGGPPETPKVAGGRTPRVASPLETAPGPVGGPPEAASPRRAVWHPHPDDGAGRGGVPAGREPGRGDTPDGMFFGYYDRYLENYRGYVELAEGLHRARDAGEVPPDSPKEREWEERLRRANDGIERTTARLDILEQHNPVLVTDDRISRRAALARRHSELGGAGGAAEAPEEGAVSGQKSPRRQG